MTTSTLRCESCDNRFPRESFKVIVERAWVSGGRRFCRMLQHDCGEYVVLLLERA